MWLAYAHAPQIDADLGQSFETLDLATNAATQGFGVAISDCSLVSEDVASKRLAMPFNIVLTTGARYYFVYPDSLTHQHKVNLFREWIGANGAA
jgi:LysR family glycine cleavage system transcriptional activator